MLRRGIGSLLAGVRSVVRDHRLELAAAILLVFFFGLWGLTATWGVRDVRGHSLNMMGNHLSSDSQLLDFDPMRNRKPTSSPVRMPWHFVGNEAVLFPFVVRIDWAIMAGPLHGSGGRTYFLWFFGLKIPFREEGFWNS